MKVKLITPLHDDAKNQDLWRVDFEEDSKPMWVSFAPTFSVGSVIDDAKLQPSRKGTSWVFKKRDAVSPSGEKPKSETRKSYGKSQDEEDWTNIRTAVMQSVAARPAQDKPYIKGIMNDANEMFADMCVMKPNRSKDAS